MASAPRSRITIDVDGKARSLASIIEGPRGDLTLTVKAASHYLGTDVNDRRVRIKQQRFSIHTTDQSPKNVNIFKHTLELDDGRLLDHIHRTSAIKRDLLFAPVFVKRHPDPTSFTYDIGKDHCDNFSLGSFEPQLFTLIVGCFVGPSDKVFRTKSLIDINVEQFTYKRFRLVVMWSFVFMASSFVGKTSHFRTEPGLYDKGTQGLNETACLKFFAAKAELLRLVQLIEMFNADTASTLEWFAEHHSRLFKTGHAGRELQDHIRTLKPMPTARGC